jgi:uncharacterized phage-associated protein
MRDFNLHKEKAVNSLLFVVNNLEKADTHKIYKILYFADQKHLLKYGRPIFGDTYVKMEYGPVPSFVKNVVDENIQGLEEVVAKYHKYFVKSLAEPNLDYLSESDLECLKEAIEENKDLDFQTLIDKSHDYAYNKAVWNINYIDMAKSAGADESLLKFISMQITNDNLELI